MLLIKIFLIKAFNPSLFPYIKIIDEPVTFIFLIQNLLNYHLN